jgi:hypothetical protein
MNKNYIYYLFILVGATLLAACGDNGNSKEIASPISEKPVIMEPFRYHKLIEVSPGQDYDILSWGRGSSAIGAFEILHSDSAAAKYTTTTGDLDGAIVDVYNSDMDLDGNPEILIQAKGKDTINYTNIYAFEFSNGKAQKLEFPNLTFSQRQGYRGDDNFYIKDGLLLREFPIYKGTGKTATKTTDKRQLQYGLRNNSFTVKQLSTDPVWLTGVKPVIKTPATSTKPAKKHTVVVKKHKKKRRRHLSEEE